MSEYQYYEFQAIDRPLNKAAREELRDLSSRAEITATSFTNTYQWGDFKGDPDALMNEWFDLHLYLANWGNRRLMIRLPERLVDRRMVDACLVEPDFAQVRMADKHLILDVNRIEMDVDWDEGPGWLARLAPLRADLLAGDTRLLYLIWLMAVAYEVVPADAPEPMPGLGPMTDQLEAFAEFFCIDPDLVQAAAERVGVADRDPVPPEAAREVISALADQDKLAFLSRMFEGDPLAAIELRAAVRRHLHTDQVTTPVAPRTAGELRARAEAVGLAREQEAARLAAEAREKLARQAEEQRKERLLAIARRGEGVWRDVEDAIGMANASSYNRAAEWLADLKAVAEARDTVADYANRIGAIRERHARKARFLERITDLA